MYDTFELNILKGKVKAWVQIPEKGQKFKIVQFYSFLLCKVKVPLVACMSHLSSIFRKVRSRLEFKSQKRPKIQNCPILFIFTMQGQSTISSMYATFELNIFKGKVKTWIQFPVKVKSSKIVQFCSFSLCKVRVLLLACMPHLSSIFPKVRSRHEFNSQ